MFRPPHHFTALTWKPGNGPGVYAGKPVKLRFEMSDADLFSIQFKQ